MGRGRDFGLARVTHLWNRWWAAAGTRCVLLFLIAAPVKAQRAPLELTHVGYVGCVACTGPEAFGSIQAIALGRAGVVWAVDRDPPHLRRFAPPTGAVVAPLGVGRSGEGPGEFGLPNGVAVTAGGSVVVSDFRRPSLQRFDSGGHYLDGRPTDAGALRIQSSPDGSWLAWQEADWGRMSASVRLLGPLEGSASFEAAGSAATPVPTTVGLMEDDNGSPVSWGLFSHAAGPDGITAVMHGGEYRIHLFGPTAAPIAVLERGIPRTARSTEELETLRNALRRGPSGSGGGGPESGALLRDPDPLRPHVWLHALAFDKEARLWVHTARGGDSRTVFDLFDQNGSYLGEVGLEERLLEFSIRDGWLAGVVTDRNSGVHRLGWWRIEWR